MSESEELRIRAGSSADLGQVEEIENSCFSDPWPRLALLAELQSDRMRWPLIGELRGKIVGYLMAWRVVDRLHILNLAVQFECRRRGIGAALLAEALARAVAADLKRATLEVRENNASAIRFYEQHGFTARGRRRNYYADTGEDAVVMNLDLAESAAR